MGRQMTTFFVTPNPRISSLPHNHGLLANNPGLLPGHGRAAPHLAFLHRAAVHGAALAAREGGIGEQLRGQLLLAARVAAAWGGRWN